VVGEWAEDASDNADLEMAWSNKGEQQERAARRIDQRMKENKVDGI